MKELDIQKYFQETDPLYIFLPNFQCGGAEKLFLELADTEFEKGREVKIIVCNSEGPLKPRNHIPIVSLNKNRVLFSFLNLFKLIPTQNIVLITTMYHCNLLCCLLKIFKPKIKLFIRESTSIMFYKDHSSRLQFFLIRLFFNIFYNLADKVITPSSQMKKLLLEYCSWINESKVEVKPNPIDFKQVILLSEEEIPVKIWARSAKNVLINIGRHDQNKNQVSILEALKKTELDYELLLLGNGEQTEFLKQRARQLGIEEKVHFLGFQENVYKFLAKSDIFILSSLNEGYPNVLNQAKALGLKIIATDCPTGPREILENYQDGRLIDLNFKQFHPALEQLAR